VTPVRSFRGSELVGSYAMAPLTGKSLPILPAKFVDIDFATGVVYSVPAHAPYDLMALRDIQEGRVETSREVRQIAASLKPLPIISLKGYSEVPAEDAVRKVGARDSMDTALVTATEEVYKEEFHRGTMTQGSGPLSGMKVSEAKEKAVELLTKTSRLTEMMELPERVVCRCGTRCFVKVLENQWFLNYSNPDWKAKTRLLIEKANVFPSESRDWYYSTIEWLNDWPCARRSGMGTKLPWDKEWIVETLSDSTIYMAYYALSKFVNQEKVAPENLTPQVCDYVFLGKGNPANVCKAAGLTEKRLREMRDEFVYWYPVDMRNSAKELIPNHLTFFAFHHEALFPERHWPKGFSVNGMIQIDGQKMSKTKGNFVTWKAALEKYGADALRLALSLTADGMDDADWRERGADDVREKVEAVLPFVRKALKSSVRRDKDLVDSWIYSSMNRRISTVTQALDSMRMRRASATAFLDVWNDIRRYIRRSGKPRRETLSDVFEAWVRLMAPFTPFVAEELHHELGGKGLVAQADWPSLLDFPVDEEADLAETLVDRVIEDARNVMKVVKEKKTTLNIFVASDEARAYFAELLSTRQRNENVGAVVKKYAALKMPPDRVFKLSYELGEDLASRVLARKRLDEHRTLSDAGGFIGQELGIKVKVQKAGAKGLVDPGDRSKNALPMKPALYLE
jgi:leucyl-tRNA synthetase